VAEGDGGSFGPRPAGCLLEIRGPLRRVLALGVTSPARLLDQELAERLEPVVDRPVVEHRRPGGVVVEVDGNRGVVAVEQEPEALAA
jgi:hypothetical protein